MKEIDMIKSQMSPFWKEGILTFKVHIKIFLILIKNSFPDPLKVEFSCKNWQKSVEIEIYWGLGTGVRSVW